ncbi:MAG: hypothetical protein JWR26_4785 [Pedosphaera sp.]|nr:hypothetical protein [Pedosphaera sp.]
MEEKFLLWWLIISEEPVAVRPELNNVQSGDSWKNQKDLSSVFGFLNAEERAGWQQIWRMKILLQESTTGLYCAKQRHWTADEKQAFNFPSCLQALSYGQSQGFHVDLIMKLTPEEAYDIRPDLKGGMGEVRQS